MNQFHPGRSVQPNPEMSARIVAAFCQVASMELQDTFSRAEVANLLRKCGYDCTPGTIAEFIRKGYIGEPAADEWPARYVHALAASLECRRRWLPTPNRLHDGKKSSIRVLIEQAKNDGNEAPIGDLDQFSIEDLLIQIAENEVRNVREALLESIRLKMSSNGWIEE